MKSENKSGIVSLTTEYEKDLEKCDLPFDEYPRPQMRRGSYLCLNGKWKFSIKNKGKATYSGDILVPFVPESRLSGIEREIKKSDVMLYERIFSLPNGFKKDRILLHFGACDQYASVSINGKQVGKNVGGYIPFCLDITDLLCDGDNLLSVEVRDPLDIELPYGKQTDKRGGMWYTKVSGIWQTVWLESVPASYIERIKITPDLSGVDIEVFGGEDEKLLIFDGVEYRFSGSHFRLDVKEPRLWSPEDPYLYSFELASGADRISSYFGLRTVSVMKKGGKAFIALNGKPYFFNGLLDQGYFSDGIFLPATTQGFLDDILKMKSCGFNMLRKHIKIEPDLFYYYCDKHGMLVFQDMINSGKYSFILDTALPTVFLKKGISHRATKRRREEFDKTLRAMLELLYSHPSVVYYTIFNEGWGQFDADSYYELCRELDPTRIYDTASGWFKPRKSDVESEHVYFKPVKLKPSAERPVVLSEFGGYSLKLDGHSFNLDNTYGYRLFTEPSKFEDALIKLYNTEIADAIDGVGLCATVLTQVSDVEDETNGLLTYDRRVLKVDEARIRSVFEDLNTRFNKKYGEN